MISVFIIWQNVWCWRSKVGAQEVDPLLRGGHRHHLLCRPLRLRPRSCWRWRNEPVSFARLSMIFVYQTWVKILTGHSLVYLHSVWFVKWLGSIWHPALWLKWAKLGVPTRPQECLDDVSKVCQNHSCILVLEIPTVQNPTFLLQFIYDHSGFFWMDCFPCQIFTSHVPCLVRIFSQWNRPHGGLVSSAGDVARNSTDSVVLLMVSDKFLNQRGKRSIKNEFWGCFGYSSRG